MILDSLGLALGGIIANKVRSMLTILSIAIGVFAVIALMAVAAGAAQGVEGQLEGLGSQPVIKVYPGVGGFEEFPGPVDLSDDGAEQEVDAFDAFDPMATAYAPPAPQPLTPDDVALLADRSAAPDVAAAVGFHQHYGALSTVEGGYVDADITGTGAAYDEVTGIEVLEGAFITGSDVTDRARVVVLSESAAGALGVGVDSEVVLQASTYRVTGVVADSYPGQPSGYLPDTTIQDTVLGAQPGYGQVIALARDEETVEPAAEQVRAALRQAHLLGPTDTLDFDVITRTAELRSVRAITLLFQVLAAAVASVALFVAGIGVMNIMLVTVTERTREIGLRKAIGARRGHLLGQFLLEAVVLTSVGGLLGTLAGAATQLVSVQGFSPVVTPFSVTLSLMFSVATGVFFGLYPANRAARMPPVEALRHE